MKPLYTHSLSSSQLIAVENIDHINPYDYKKLHRHNYFEIFFFKVGGGSQIVDFIKFPVENNSVHIVPPGRVHLLNRLPEANGYVIQFSKDILALKQQEVLMSLLVYSNENIYHQYCENLFSGLIDIVLCIKNKLESDGEYSGEMAFHYLSILVYKILAEVPGKAVPVVKNELITDFIQKVELNFKDIREVNRYAELLHVSPRKLSELTQKHLGKKPLEVIHEHLLLEIKRMMIHGQVSLKEIGYHLNFESQVAFSKFVKAKTNKTPSELAEELALIHK